MEITIRRECESDYRTVEEMTRRAFWNLHVPGCDEHYLVHMLRSHADFIAELDFVALVDGQIAGNIMYTRSYVVSDDGEKIQTLTFGPLCVSPEYQRRGIGTALLNHTKQIAIQNGEKAIIILGFPHNYCTHGFKNSKDYNISNAESRFPHGQLMLELEKGFFGAKRYAFHHSAVYELDEKEVECFEMNFKPMVKAFKPSQEEFSIAVRSFLD